MSHIEICRRPDLPQSENVERADARAITDPCELFLVSTFREARKKDRFKLLKAALKAAGKSKAEA